MNKKIFALLLVLIFIFILTACSVDKTNIYELKELRNGNNVGSFTIRDISNTEEGRIISYGLEGETLIKGELSYTDALFEGYYFNITESNLMDFEISIDFPDKTKINHSIYWLKFSNQEDLEAKLTQETITNLKNGDPIDLSIKVKDVNVVLRYQSEYENVATFIEIVN